MGGVMFYFLCIPLLDLRGDLHILDFLNVKVYWQQTGYHLLYGFYNLPGWLYNESCFLLSCEGVYFELTWFSFLFTSYSCQLCDIHFYWLFCLHSNPYSSKLSSGFTSFGKFFLIFLIWLITLLIMSAMSLLT